MDNIVSVKLDSRYASTLGVWQYDYGQVLRITGPELPPAVEVQFSLDEKSGETLSRVGTTVDGVTEVKIPDELLTHSATSNYRIYAYIYLTDETSGNTKYEITIPVRARSKPTSPAEDPETDPDLFRETVVGVDTKMNNAKMLTAQHSTAQHSTAQHSTAQHSTAQHSTAQHSTAQHSLRRRLLASAVTEKDDNLIDLNAYSESANTYVQDIAIDNVKTYYAYDISYIVCYNKFGSNMGLATIASDGTVAMKPDTIMIRVNISKNKNPYFGLTKR